MKNKANTVKQILTRVMLVVILLTSVLGLSGCRKLFGNYRANRNMEYYSHAEFVEFIEKYNSKNDGFVSTFISFDFDSNEIVSYRYYHWGIVAKLNDYYDKIYDKYQDYLTLRMTYYINDIDENGDIIKDAYQIYCSYSTKGVNYNFDANDNLSLNLFDTSTTRPVYLGEWFRVYNPNDNEYNYITTYSLYTNGVDVMQISIASLEKELSQEKIDEICKLLMDNIVIINTEG